MKKLLLILLFFISFLGWGQSQGNMLYITQQIQPDLTICGDSRQFQVTIYNPTPWTITSCSLSITLPTGIQHDNTSPCTVPGFINSFGGIIKVNLPDIGPLQTQVVTYCLKAQCNVLQFISSGGVIKNTAKVNYTANNVARFDLNTSATYLIRQPNVTITSITNQSYNGNIGDVFTRCIKVVNGGSGGLTSFTLTDLHATGIQITAIDKGVWTTSGQTEKVVLGPTDFMTIGDGDGLFESGESINICETVTVLNCISATSSFKAFWGCSVNACQASVSSANVVFPNYVPNLVVTPTASMNSCIGSANASPQQLRIINTGLGKAVNVVFDIFQSTSNGYNQNSGSRIDETSLTIQTGLNGAPAAVTPTSTQATNNLNCMTNAKGRVGVSIAQINPGDTLYLKWNTYSCCYNACTNVGQSYINGWRYKATYSSVCLTNYFVNEAWGRVYSQIYGALTPDGAPSTLSNGQNGTFTFLFSNYNNSYPVGAGAHWKFVFKLPPYGCINYSNIRIIHSNGTSTWSPTTVTSAGDSVIAIFNGGAPFNLTQAELKINLALVCSGCTGTELLTQLSVKSYYIPNSSCSCEIGVSCQTIPFNINCPDPCPEGIMFANFDMQRTSYGLPDNEAGGGNGIPDGSGSLDFNKIKTNRVMFGDTITTNFYGVANTSMAYPTLPFVYAKSSISNGDLFSFIDAQLKIYRGGSLLLTCPNITPTITTSGSTRDFFYDLSETTLSTCLSTYDYTDYDSLVLTCRYKDTSNIGNVTPVNCFSANRFYSSVAANPTQEVDKLQCGTINGNCTVIGYYFFNHEGENYETVSCNNVLVRQNYYLSVGPTWNNDAGGNLFPFEYRNWAHIKKITATIPSGYSYVSAQFINYRTAGTLGVSNSGPISVTPTSTNSDTLEFNLENKFSGFGGTVPLSDDGFYGTLEITVQPGCQVVPETYNTVTHNMDFGTTSALTGPGSLDPTSYFRNSDQLIYDAPDLFLQSTLPSILAFDSLESWEIIISNSSNVSNAMNVWISAPSVSGIDIVKVEDLGNNTVIPINGEVYQLGTVAAMGERRFRLTGSYTSCELDSVIIYSGWNCIEGYPDSISNYPCTPERIALTLTPILPALQVTANGPASPIQLCDTATIVALGNNIQLGTAYSVTLTAYLPTGAVFIPNTSELSYPLNSPYVSISDPVSLGNNQYRWNVSAVNSTIGSDGLKGLLDTALNNFNIRFKVTTSCGYVSGNNINFSISGVAVCGDTTEFQVFQSNDLDIVGLDEPYSTSIEIKTTYVSPCATNSGIKLVVHNMGPTSFGNTDSVSFKLPTGVSFVPGSFSGVHNAPPNGVPALSTIGGADYLTWRMPAGVVAGDSSVFNFQFAGEPVLLSCGIVFFEANTKSSSVIVCSVTGQNCQSNVATGDTTLAVFIYKAYLGFTNGTAVSVPNPPSGETVTLTFDITNTGQAIEINADSVIQYYFDIDGDSVYTVADIFIGQDTVLVPKDTTITYTTTLNVPAGQACAILAVVDPGINNCVCDPTQLVIFSTLSSLGNDTTICSGATMTMSYPPVTGYTYAWTPTTSLNDGTLSDPLLTASNLTANPISTTYTLATNRIGCNGNDTMVVTVNPLPTATITGATVVCENSTSPSVIFTGAIGESPYTFIYSRDGVLDTVISLADTSMIPVPTDTPGTYFYTLISVQDSSIATCAQLVNDSVKIIVNPLPEAVAQLASFSDICQGGASPTVVFIGSNGLSPYTFTYNIDGGANQTIVSTIGDSAFIAAPTNVPGTYTYHIVSVQDASTTICSQNQDDSISVKINPLPTAVISGNSIVCRQADSPIIEFVGTTGTAPFTFNYTIDGIDATPVTSTNGDTAYVSVPTNVDGTFVYALTGVTDSSSTACYQAQTGSVTIIVEPLPTANIQGSTVICQHAIEPMVTFIGNGGYAPYTFVYKLNGVTQPPIQTISGDSVSILAPTADTGTFVYSLVSVTDSNVVSCTHPQTGDVTIIVNPKVNVAFTADSVCNGNPTLFTDASTTASGTLTSWTWNLGDLSNTVNTQNPFYVYASGGIYNVELIVNNSFNCPDTLTKNVQVYYNPVVSFSHDDVCLGDTICFTNTSTVHSSGSITDTIWVFGDGSPTSNVPAPCHYYNSAGTYNVTLVVTTNQGCSGVTTLPVKTFDYPNSSFTFLNTCLFDSASFTNTSQNPTMGTIASFTWDFGDMSADDSTIQSPAHLYQTPGDYVVTLINLSSNLGCADTITDTITVYPMPLADFSSEDVCLLQSMSFYDSSEVSLNSVDTWSWNFGDNTALNTNQNPSHIFANDTSYTVTLISTTTNGCKDTIQKLVTVHPLPNVDFIAPNVCDGNPIAFSDATTITNTDTLATWLWNFGDSSAVVTSQNSIYEYATDGIYNVQLIVTSTFGCIDSITKPNVVNPNPIVSYISSDTVGCEPLCINFTNTSEINSGLNTQWIWSFGDGSTGVVGENVSHCYSNDSVTSAVFYTTTLVVVSDSGCASTLNNINNITVYPKPEASFIITPETLSIIDPVIMITDLSVGATIWEWNFGDSNDTLNTTDSVIYHEYADTGTYTVSLITTTPYGCRDTAYNKTIIEPEFTFYVPNAFSPNGDGINDIFAGKGLFITKYEMLIFDRWGNLAFETDDYNKQWDGRANKGEKMAQRDVYVYKIKVTDIHQIEHFYSGTVTLVQ